MAGILDQILSGVQKLPGNMVGAPVDLANIVANLGRAGYGYAGSKLGLLKAGDLPDLEDNPIGGSKSINSVFGLGKSTGAIDDLTQAVGGLITPGNLAGAATAVILPARILSDTSTVAAAGKLIGAGKADRVYDLTKIFQGNEPISPQLKQVLPDTGASLAVGGVLRTSEKNRFYDGTADLRSTETKLPSDFNGYLSDVLDHPALFKAVPELADIRVSAQASPGGSWNPDSKMIKLGPSVGSTGGVADKSSDEGFMSVILHETQHAIQQKFGFTGGSNPGFFLRDAQGLQTARMAADLDTTPAGSANRVTLAKVVNDANDAYMNTSGETEARIVQQQFKKNDYSVSPGKIIANMEAAGDTQIHDISKVPKADSDPAIQQLIDFYNQSPF